jgi:Uma2 family endonuclease
MNLEHLSPERIRPLSRAEYEGLVERGAFADERIELLYGQLVEMSPQNPAHAQVIRQLTKMLQRALGERADVQAQLPIALRDDSEPEPDVALVPAGDHSRHHPTSAFLAVEVADSSLQKDRLIKSRLYAEAGVPEYWVVNLKDQLLERCTEPAEGTYRKVENLARHDSVRLFAFPDVELRVSSFLPT